jgi:hypothetical protein
VALNTSRLAVRELIPSSSFSLFAHGSLSSSGVVQERSGAIAALGGCAPLGEDSLGVGSWVRVATLRVSGRQAGLATVRTAPSTDGYGIAVLNQLGLLDAPEIECGASSFRLRAGMEADPTTGAP